MCTAQLRDVMQQFTQPQPKENQQDSILIGDRNPDGTPVGIGGHRRNRKIMDLVRESQGLKIRE